MINRTYRSGVERSERNVSIDNVARIARGLKVKPWTLWTTASNREPAASRAISLDRRGAS
jgi:hypothetical protein